MSDDDLISDIVRRVAAALHIDVSGEVLEQIERQVRQDWAGNKVYISRQDRKARDARIRQLWRSGVGVNELATRFGISRRRVRQIIMVRE